MATAGVAGREIEPEIWALVFEHAAAPFEAGEDLNSGVNMRLTKVTEGRAFVVYALDLASGSEPPDCPAMELLDSLSDRSRKSW